MKRAVVNTKEKATKKSKVEKNAMVVRKEQAPRDQVETFVESYEKKSKSRTESVEQSNKLQLLKIPLGAKKVLLLKIEHHAQ